MSPDPWTAFLDWLSTVLVPSWSELIGLLPIVATGMVVGPILTVIVLMWVWYVIKRRRGHVKRAEPQRGVALVDSNGSPLFPPNVPYCEEHALVYPPRAKQCNVDQAELHVSCPVDGTVRLAAIDICASCGTKFTLGAGSGGGVVTSTVGVADSSSAMPPPEPHAANSTAPASVVATSRRPAGAAVLG